MNQPSSFKRSGKGGDSGGGNAITVDKTLSLVSTNPVQNKVITAALDDNVEMAKAYTNNKITDLINGSPETLDTLKEVADAIKENETVVEALGAAIGNKANKSELNSHIEDKSNPHEVTAKQIHFEPVVETKGYTIGNLQTEIRRWYSSAAGTLSVFRFSGDGNIDFYINNWIDNSGATDSLNYRAIYTVEIIGATDSVAGTFLIMAEYASDETAPFSFIVSYVPNAWHMYGRLVTEKSNLPIATSEQVGGVKSGGDISVEGDGTVAINKSTVIK